MFGLKYKKKYTTNKTLILSQKKWGAVAKRDWACPLYFEWFLGINPKWPYTLLTTFCMLLLSHLQPRLGLNGTWYNGTQYVTLSSLLQNAVHLTLCASVCVTVRNIISRTELDAYHCPYTMAGLLTMCLTPPPGMMALPCLRHIMVGWGRPVALQRSWT